MSSRVDVALATCARLPEPDPDAEPLLEALARAGISAEFLAWDDPAADFSRARLTLLRSTWNYPQLADEFGRWLDHTAAVSELWNPLPVVRWNIHKSYLLDLERRGVAVAPTELVRRGDSTSLRSIRSARNWEDVVVKPAVSAASYRTLRVRPGHDEAGESHLRLLAADGDVLVQRYLPSVEDHGERALVWIDGELTHSVRKSPRFEGQDESVSEAQPISDAEAELAEEAIAAIDGEPLYARIDAAPAPGGGPVVMELELIEPSLFFPQAPQALERLVEGIRRRLARRPPS